MQQGNVINVFLVIEGKIKGQIEVTRRRGGRRKKLLDDLNLLAPELFFSILAHLYIKCE